MKIVLFIGFAIVLYIIYKRSIKRIDSDLASAPIDYTSRGLHKFKQRNYQGALDDYTKAIQNNPKNWIAYNNRGNTFSIMHHDAQTNEEKLRLINLAMKDFATSLDIKSYNEGNTKAATNLLQLQEDKNRLSYEFPEKSNTYQTDDINDFEDLSVEDFKNLLPDEEDDHLNDEDMRFQKHQNDNPETTRVFTDLLKNFDKIGDNEDAINRLNKMMESINKSDPNKSIPIDETVEFGHSFNNPIVVSNILNGYIYLKDLRTLRGNPITYERLGSEINSNGVNIDKYEIYEKGKYITDLYINCYGSTNSKLAPRGFSYTKIAHKSDSLDATTEGQRMIDNFAMPVKSSSEPNKFAKEKVTIEQLVQPLCNYSKLSFPVLLFRKSVLELISRYAEMGLIDVNYSLVNVTKWRFALFLTRMLKFRLEADPSQLDMSQVNPEFKRLLTEYLLFYLVPNADKFEHKALAGEQNFDITMVSINEDIKHYWLSNDSAPLVHFLYPTVRAKEEFLKKTDFEDFHTVITNNINHAVEYCLSRRTNS